MTPGAVGCAVAATAGFLGSLAVESGAAMTLALSASGRAMAATAERTVERSMRGPPAWLDSARVCALPGFTGPPSITNQPPFPSAWCSPAPSLDGYPGSQPDIADSAKDADSRVNTFGQNP